MTVRVVTDSTADLPDDVVSRLGIAVVPLHVILGGEVFDDGVTISSDEFYRRLTTPGIAVPTTASPSAKQFTELYETLAQETSQIVSIHISTRLSATYAAARIGQRAVHAQCRISFIDSLSASIGLGLLVIQAATMAREGASLEDIVRVTRASIPRTAFFGVLDTLEYLNKGGRIGRAAAFLESKLNVRPILCLRDGVVHPIERVLGREEALNRLCMIVRDLGVMSHLAVAYTTDQSEMEQFATRLSQYFPTGEMVRSRCGATLGTYLGPRALCVAAIRSPDNAASA